MPPTSPLRQSSSLTSGGVGVGSMSSSATPEGRRTSRRGDRAIDVRLAARPQELDLILRRNLISAVATCVAVADVMKEQRSGAIVTIGSVNGIEALKSGASAHYGTAKAAVIMYTRYLAQELDPFNVRVNC